MQRTFSPPSIQNPKLSIEVKFILRASYMANRTLSIQSLYSLNKNLFESIRSAKAQRLPLSLTPTTFNKQNSYDDKSVLVDSQQFSGTIMLAVYDRQRRHIPIRVTEDFPSRLFGCCY